MERMSDPCDFLDTQDKDWRSLAVACSSPYSDAIEAKRQRSAGKVISNLVRSLDRAKLMLKTQLQQFDEDGQLKDSELMCWVRGDLEILEAEVKDCRRTIEYLVQKNKAKSLQPSFHRG